MHGNLQDIDLSSLLYFVESKQKSGVVFIEKEPLSKTNTENFYFIFFYLGKIVYGGDQQSFSLIRLQNYLSYYNLAENVKLIGTELMSSVSIAEYEALILLSKKQVISRQQEKDILAQIIKETLFATLSLNRGFFTFNCYYFLQPQINTFQIEEFLPQVYSSLRQWKQSYGYIQSSEQCPIISDNLKLKAFLNNKIYQNFSSRIDGNTSFLQLARYLHKDLGSIARVIHPCIERGWIKVINPALNHDFQDPKRESFFKIICITSDKNWALNTRSLLTPEKYNFVVATNISQGLENVFNIVPNLILFALESSSLNKYQFCQIIRNTKSLIHVPIILIVNHFLFEENLRAKMAGATEYMTKNVLNKNIFNIIDKYTF